MKLQPPFRGEHFAAAFFVNTQVLGTGAPSLPAPATHTGPGPSVFPLWNRLIPGRTMAPGDQLRKSMKAWSGMGQTGNVARHQGTLSTRAHAEYGRDQAMGGHHAIRTKDAFWPWMVDGSVLCWTI